MNALYAVPKESCTIMAGCPVHFDSDKVYKTDVLGSDIIIVTNDIGLTVIVGRLVNNNIVKSGTKSTLEKFMFFTN